MRCATIPAANAAQRTHLPRLPSFLLAHGSLMNIFTNTVVTLTFELFDADGVLLESTDEPITYLHGGHSGMLPKL